jgi:hypothetical protein
VMLMVFYLILFICKTSFNSKIEVVSSEYGNLSGGCPLIRETQRTETTLAEILG